MKKQKRFTATQIVSNSTRLASFDTIEEARTHVEKERSLHPRSKLFNPVIYDSVEQKYIN